MNGRCHKDPLDRADDICELCGHQFSARYLLYPRGHRNPPTCKACALQNSGLRGGGGKAALSKREYKKRKKQLLALLETVEEEEPRLEAIELSDPTPFDNSTELDRRSVDVEAAPTIDILGNAEAEPEPPAFVPPPPPAPMPEPEPAPELPDDDFGPIDTSVNPLAIDFGERPASAPRHATPEPAPAPVAEESSAADLLARLKADQPIESQYTSPPPRHTTPAAPFDADPFASTEHDRRSPSPAAAPSAADEPDTAVDPFAPAPTAPTSTPAPAPTTSFDPAPAPVDERRADAAPASSAAPKAAPWTPPAPPPRGSNLHAMAGGPAPGEDRPATAPLADDQPTTALAESSTPASERADTDSSGQWIPPSLRGMTAPEERDPLPKRR